VASLSPLKLKQKDDKLAKVELGYVDDQTLIFLFYFKLSAFLKEGTERCVNTQISFGSYLYTASYQEDNATGDSNIPELHRQTVPLCHPNFVKIC